MTRNSRTVKIFAEVQMRNNKLVKRIVLTGTFSTTERETDGGIWEWRLWSDGLNCKSELEGEEDEAEMAMATGDIALLCAVKLRLRMAIFIPPISFRSCSELESTALNCLFAKQKRLKTNWDFREPFISINQPRKIIFNMNLNIYEYFYKL